MADRKSAWNKLHKLECCLDYFMQERDSKSETVNSKHAWDMILLHIIRELKDTKSMLSTSSK